MGEFRLKEEERRRNPRFSVGGWATVHRLPLEGMAIPATVRNLSVGGVCLDVGHALELGARTELLLSVNAACFRAAALVRGQSASNTRLQFVQISQEAKSVLEDLIERLTKLQTLTRKLRSVEIDKEMEQKLLDTGRFRIVAVGEGEGAAAGDGRGKGETEVSASEGERIVQLKPRLVEIDLFG